jgi:hypothetical protein
MVSTKNRESIVATVHAEPSLVSGSAVQLEEIGARKSGSDARPGDETRARRRSPTGGVRPRRPLVWELPVV